MNRFEFYFDIEKEGLFIRHSLNPECLIEIIVLEREALWAEVAGLDDVFDFFLYRKNKDKILFMLLVKDEEIEEGETRSYRSMLAKAWKWLLHGTLLKNIELPHKLREITLEEDENDPYSIEVEEGTRYVYHRAYPVFRAQLKENQDALGILQEIEFIDHIDPLKAQSYLREMGDWIAKHL